MEDNKIIIYQTPDGQTSIDVTLDRETVWLTQGQMSELFQQTKQNISLHVRNIFKEQELEENSVVKESLTTASDGKRYKIKQYNLDIVISVGYRVKSLRGTQFRIWANNVLRDYLIKGYALNEKRLNEQNSQYEALKQAVQLLGNVLTSQQPLTGDEATGLLKIITDYTYALDVLDKYDHRTLTIEAIHKKAAFVATYEKSMKTIQGLREKFGGSSLFGNEKDESFKSSIATIYQSFGGQDLYPSVEEKAAHLLYFVIKNHSFSDGNKRIAAFLFVWF